MVYQCAQQHSQCAALRKAKDADDLAMETRNDEWGKK